MRARFQPLAVTALTALLSASLAAGTFQVKAGQSIQDAIDNASGGDTIAIASGVYYETLQVPTELVNLKIVGKGQVVLDARVEPDGYGAGITVHAFDVSLRNLTIRHAASGSPPSSYDKSGRGVRVMNHGVTLDRITVIGSTSEGIRVDGDDATLTNCRVIAAGSDGVQVFGQRAHVERLEVLGANGWAVVGSGNDGVVRLCSLRANSGIAFDGEDLLIERNTQRGGLEGIFIIGEGAVVQRNTVHDVLDTALRAEGEGVQVLDNVADGAQIGVRAHYEAIVRGNTISNVEFGVEASSALEVVDNTITYASRYGIDVHLASGGVLSGNRLMACGALHDPAARITGSNATISGNQWKGSLGTSLWIHSASDLTLEKNKLSDGFRNGIVVADGCSQTRLMGNQIKNHMGEGIQNWGTTTTLEKNTSLGNRLPLTNSGSVVDLGGNKFGKGTPAPGSAPEPELVD